MMKQRAKLKINPPLRPTTAVEGLWKELGEGRIDIVSSDHAPWPLAMKTKDYILENASGVPGVETLPTLVLGQALRRDPSLVLFNAALDAMTIAPAQRFGLSSRKGSLGVGKDADIMVFQPGEQAIDGSAQHSNAGWSPYDGLQPGGAVTHVFSRGSLIYSAADGLDVTPGRGEILTRDDVR
jgi:allantoinase